MFIYNNNRNHRQNRIIEAASKSTWVISDIFLDHQVSSYGEESERLKWAPILVALAFGENTAFSGFGRRIIEATDISAKSWLCAHLFDESKHTEGFSRLLDYLYPSYKNNQAKLFNSRDAILFYGYTHQCNSLVEWLICTQIAEVFGRYCYKELYNSFKAEPVIEKFFKNILIDEARHISYINELIKVHRINLTDRYWNKYIKPFTEKMIFLGRNMFEARKKGKNYFALSSLNIDVEKFCDSAQADLTKALS